MRLSDMSGALASAAAGSFVVLFTLFAALAVGGVVLFVLCLVDMVRRPDWQWKLAGQEKILWIVLLCLVNAFGIVGLIYWFSIRKKLIAVELAAASGQYGGGYTTAGGWVPGAYVAPPVGGWPPGWYPDPAGTGGRRWWDGSAWTHQVQPGPPAGGPGPPLA